MTAPAATRVGAPSYVWLLRARNVIDRRYQEPLELADLAATAFASPSHFSRAFASAFGETPIAYRRRRRMERAKELLRNTEMSVTEVALAVGFTSLGTFSTTFRSMTGRSPRDYRRRSEPSPAIPGCFAMMGTRPLAGTAVSEK